MTFAVGEFRARLVLAAARSGRVWLADAPGRADPVVLRMHDRAHTARVEAEFRIAAGSGHPHLLPVLAMATCADGVALVSVYAAGGSLRDRLAVGTLRPGQVVTLLAAMSSALAYCHADLAVVHGGVRVSQVLFAGDGRPMLAGLGAVAAALGAGEAPSVPPGDMSPEMARGAPAVPADDVFALGSVALQALCGRPAWPADGPRDVVIQSGFGQWPGPDDSCPRRLARIVGAMLAREPADRPTAAEVYRALGGCDDPEPIDLPIRGAAGPATPDVIESAAALAPAVDVVPAPERPPPALSPGPPGAPGRRRGRHADLEADVEIDSPAADGRQSPAGWLDAPDQPSWSLSPHDGSSDAGQPAALAVTPVASARHAVRDDLRRPTRPAVHRRPDRWRHTALTAVVALALAVGSVVAGLWWASSDATPSAVLPPVAEALPAGPSDPSDPAAVRTPIEPATSVDGTDWLTVITELDARRSDAFAAADADLLAGVYAPGAAARAVDAARITSLTEAGLRVGGLYHEITSVRLTDRTALTVSVVDSMPPQPVLDAAGTVVAYTAEQASATRIIRLAATAEGYLIAEIAAAG